MRRSDQLRDLQILAILVPALCAGLYEALRHSLLPTDLPFGLGTLAAVAIVLAISFGFAHVSFGMIRRTEARLRERNRELQELSREVERLAVLEERDRLAREIHDGVAQVLASLLVRLDTVEALAERGRVDELATEVRELRGAGAEAYADVREAIADLRTRPEPGALGLERALSEYVAQFGDRVGVSATFDADTVEISKAQLPPVAEMQLLRIAQEALANVRKHAAASEVRVRLWQHGGEWHIDVEDDGIGFAPDDTRGSERGHQLGLQIMRERAESLGGGVSIETTSGQGTRVHAWVPARPAARAGAPTMANAREKANGATAAAAR